MNHIDSELCSFCAVLLEPADLRVPDPFHTMIAVSDPQLSDDRWGFGFADLGKIMGYHRKHGKHWETMS